MFRNSVLCSSVLLSLCLCHTTTAMPVLTEAGVEQPDSQVLEVVAPRLIVEEFIYVPTRDGYRYKYKVPNGPTREEIGYLINPDVPNENLKVLDEYASSERKPIEFEEQKGGIGPRKNAKNRKLSPKSLQSLAG